MKIIKQDENLHENSFGILSYTVKIFQVLLKQRIIDEVVSKQKYYYNENLF